jgi:hypothetical protein
LRQRKRRGHRYEKSFVAKPEEVSGGEGNVEVPAIYGDRYLRYGGFQSI